MALLIKNKDIREYRSISDNFSQDKMDRWILEAQRMDIRPILGDAFYHDFVENFDVTGHAEYTNYQNLLNGTTYTHNSETIKFEGLKPCVVYYTYARMIKNQQINVNPFSVTQKLVQESQQVSSATLKMQVDDAISSAVVYQQETVQFLETQISLYPLWTQRDSAVVRRGALNFFKA